MATHSSVRSNGRQPKGIVMARLLLIDDDPSQVLDQMNHLFPPRGFDIVVARSGAEGIEQTAAHLPDVVVLNAGLPDLPGLEVFQRLRQIDARLPVIFITGTTMTETAIEAMRQGAYDYLFKPIDLRQLEKVVEDAAEIGRTTREAAVVADVRTGGNGDEAAIIGRCPGMREVYKAIGRVADQPVMVLITGESGTGKELAARAIYQHSDRARSPFLAINCAAIPESLLESELFGHERGAFTGADRRRIGKFEQCNGGTLFLDEIGDMPMATQGKILRVLQDQTFERVGGNQTIRTDVRLIAATNQNLKAAATAGRFRPDLYYRLSVFTIHLPPLRERGEDLPLLVQYYLQRFNGELGREVRGVDPESMDRLRGYTWPGNVRELQSVLKQALLRAQGTVLLPAFLPDLGVDLEEPARHATDRRVSFESFIHERLQAGTTDLHAEARVELDRILLPLTLRATRGNQVQAAHVLGVARQTLRNRLRELGLNVTTSVEESRVEAD
jgi:two-component system nitrogen regulation response regulator GlnG